MDPAPVLVAVRFALYLDLMLVFGWPLFLLYTLPAGSSEGVGGKFSIGMAALALAGIALTIFGLLLLAAAMSDVSVAQLDRATLDALLNETPIGLAGKVRGAALLAMVPMSFWPRARPRFRWAVVAGLGAVALSSLAWTGHGAADEGAGGLVHLTADIVHLLAAGAWIGALAGLLMLIARSRADSDERLEGTALAHRALAGFGTVGTICVGAIILTGLVNSWFLVGVGNILSLAGSLYGRLLIIKLVLFVAMLGLAGLNRLRLTPALETSLREGDGGVARRSIGRSVAIESSLALIILALVAWFGTLAPPAVGG